MTQRERHTPDGGVPAPPGLTGPPGAGSACVWEAFYQAAPPGRQQQLLALAGRQGVLYAHQLPPAVNGSNKRPLLAALLNGQIQDLLPLRCSTVECVDASLDLAQRDAVARALQTPDVCFVQGYPGSGKSRAVVEIVAQAVARGEHVLILAPNAAVVDCVLERLEGRDGVCAVRCLSIGERPESLPPVLRRLLFEERLRSFHEETLPAAKQATEEAVRRCVIRRQEEGEWDSLEKRALRLQALGEELGRLADALSRMEQEVESDSAAGDDASAFRKELAVCRAARDEAAARLDARLAELQAEVEKLRGEQKAATTERERLHILSEALREGRWWTVAWWRARQEGDVARCLTELESKQAEHSTALQRLTHEIEERSAERGQVETRYREQTAALRRQEVECRRSAGQERLAVLAREQAEHEEQIRAAWLKLSEGQAPPPDLSAVAVCDGLQSEILLLKRAWSHRREQDELQAATATQWADALEKSLDSLPERLTQCVNVVGAVTSALSADPRFGDHVLACVPFDLLILEEAHLVTESEFLAAARRARRWVLVGEPTDADLPPAGRRTGPARSTRPSTLRPGFFQRLWRLLHSDPGCLPYAWFHRGERLVCRLRSIVPDEEKWVVSEHLADRPEIELRFAAPPQTAPRLFEVVFPGATTVHEAKGFIFRELGELPIEARGGGFRWRDDAEGLVLDLSDGAVPDGASVLLTDGVCERMGGAAPFGEGGACWRTCSLEFDRAANWTRERAEAWVEDHLQTRNLGRTALLNTPHRCRPPLAQFLSGLLFDGAFSPRKRDDGLGVEFVPVPSYHDDSARRPSDGEGRGRRGGTATLAPRLRSARGGAGLEIDLADPRRLDPLPAELRAALPGQGLVNLFEAQAVVRKLEALMTDAAFRAAADEWARQETPGADPLGARCPSASCHAATETCVGRRPTLAVMALYPAQADLIRLLAAQSSVVASASVAVEIDSPDAFRQRECFVALVSLTRSHSHRAVPFGGDSSWLPTALTRAVSRLILFGDPGTLARRCQWNGALDHLDETAGERERGRIAHLLAYLQGHGSHPSTFGFDESGGV